MREKQSTAAVENYPSWTIKSLYYLKHLFIAPQLAKKLENAFRPCENIANLKVGIVKKTQFFQKGNKNSFPLKVINYLD